MTIEEEFFKCFGIEPKWKDKRVKYAQTYYTEEQAEYLRRTTKNRNIQLCYPEITAEILLKLICIYTQFFDIGDNVFKDTKDLKNFILQGLILDISANLKRQVKSLFEGEE